MKLVHKMTASLLISACTVLGIYGYLTVRREEEMLEGAVIADAHLIARTMRVSFIKVWRAEGHEAALRLLRDASASEERLEFLLVSLPEERSGETLRLPRLDPRQVSRLEAGQRVVQIERETPTKLHLYLPLDLPGVPPAALLLTESLEHEKGYVTQTKVRIGVTTLALVLISGVFAFGIGTRIVGNPMRKLMDKADLVGKGNLEGPLDLRQSDEIGQLAARMNRMCEDLSRETTRRVAALDQLRHAERLSTVGQLASGIAHELGTPLNVVLGRAMMNTTGNGNSPKEVAENSRIIVEQTERMSNIIRQLLDFARRGTAAKAPVDVREVVRRLLCLLEPLANEAHVSLDAELPEVAIAAPVDTAQIEQALTNVVINAIQATPEEGDVRMSVELTEAQPPGRPELNGRYVRITIRDQGPGIAEELQTRVFEPFFTTKEVGQGTGLGLPVAHGIVTDHDGWIEVESEAGRGSSFSIYLPAVEGAV